MMSKKSKSELVESYRPRYLKASKAEKTRIITQIQEATGLNRKTIIRKMHAPRKSRPYKKPGRKRIYTETVISILKQVWEWSEYMCSKRLKPYLAEFVEKLESCKRLELDDETKTLLLSMSAATIDRCLKKARLMKAPKGHSATKPGTLLKNQIPIKVYTPWDDEKPGFIEIDLVAHCGDNISGQYLYTLTATDIATGWTEMIAIENKTQIATFEGLKMIQKRFPFPILGIDSDNGAEFINALLYSYCKNNQISFTRCRAYKKNDQAHVEQKNWSKVRTNVGYDRFTTEEEQTLLNDLYFILHYLENLFRPVMKLVEKQRIGARVKKVYDLTRSPYRRVIEDDLIDIETKDALIEMYNILDPVELLEMKNNYTARILKIAR